MITIFCELVLKDMVKDSLTSRKYGNIQTTFLVIIVAFLIMGVIYIYNTWRTYAKLVEANAVGLAESAEVFLLDDH